MTTLETINSFHRWHSAKFSQRWTDQSVSVLKGVLRNYLEKDIKEISFSDIDQTLSSCNDVSPSTTNRYISILKLFFRKSVQWGYIDKSPASQLTYYKNPPGRIRFLKKEEWDRLEAECQNAGELGKVIVFALYTGMRRSEILKLRWADVLFDIGVISLLKTKNGAPRSVPMHPTVLKMLQDKVKCCNWVFCFQRHQIVGTTKIHRLFERFMTQIELPDFTFHDLRHTFATYMIINGANIREVQEILGHKDINTTLRYLHTTVDHLKAAMNKFRKPDKSIEDIVKDNYGEQGPNS